MATIFEVPIEDVNDQMDAGYTTIRVRRGTTADGTLSLTTDEATLVADQIHYSITVTAGTGNWVTYDLYTGSVASAAAPPVYLEGALTLLEIMAEAAVRAGAGFSGVAGTSATGYLVDAELQDQADGAQFLQGAWIYRPDAVNAGDVIRRASTWDTSNNRLNVTRAWTAAPDAETYYVFQLLPPTPQPGTSYSWQQAARDALRRIRYRDLVFVRAGYATTVPSPESHRFSLDPYLNVAGRDDIVRVLARRYNTSDELTEQTDQNLHGRWWDIEQNRDSGDRLTLILGQRLSTDDQLWVDVKRGYDLLYDPDGVTACPVDLAALVTAMQVYKHLNTVQDGKYIPKIAGLARDAHELARMLDPMHFLAGVP